MSLARTPRLVTADHAMSWTDSVALIVWRRRTTPEGVEAVTWVLDRAIAASRAAGVVIVVEPDATPPDSSVRRALAEAFERSSSEIRGVAVIVEGGGFHASMVRGVVTGLALLARYPYPYRVFASANLGVSWLHPLVTHRASAPTRWVHALADLRSGETFPAHSAA